MRRLLSPLLLVLPACAEITPPPDGAVSRLTDDALVGGGMPRRDGGAAAFDAAPPPPPPPEGCGAADAPLCAACGADGTPQPLADDPRCPALDCSIFDTFVRTTEGGTEICVRTRFAPAGGRCLAVGRCREAADAAWCADRTAEEAARADRPCQAMQGCAGSTPPSFAPAPEGTPCEGGRCDAEGACLPVVDDDRCDPWAAGTVCRTGVHINGESYCEVATDGGSCFDACGAGGSYCIAARAAGPGVCEAGAERGCIEAGAAQLCWCRVRSEQ